MQRDDPGRERGRPPRGARPAAADPAGRLRGDLRGDGRAAGDDPAARPAAARVPAARSRRRPTSACARRIRALHEANPMLGTRGCRLGLQCPEIYEMQVRAIVRAALAVRERTGRGAARRDHAPARRLRRGAAPAARADRCGSRPRRARRRVPRRDDDRAAARVRPRRRDRRARRLLLVRHERPDADGARLLARRRRGQVPHATTSRTACSSATRSRRSTRSGVGELMRIAVERGRAVKRRPEARHLRRARRRARARSRSATSSGSTTSRARRTACRSRASPRPRRR